MSVLAEPEIVPELRMTVQGCAGAAIQAAAGLVALGIACRTAAGGPVLASRLDARQLEHVNSLLEGLAATIEETWKGDLKELFEVIVVLAAETAESVEDESRFRQIAQGLFLDTRPMAILEDDVDADVEIDQAPDPKRHRVRKPRDSRESYQQERLENLVHRAVALGVKTMHPVIATGYILIVGVSARGKEEKLVKLRGSMKEATKLCEDASTEIQRMDAVADVM